MAGLAGVRFTEAGPVSYCSVGDIALGVGDYVVVSSERGDRLGWVVIPPDQVLSGDPRGPLRAIERVATEHDVRAWRTARERADEDRRRAQELASRSDSRVRVASLQYDLAGEFCEITFAASERIEHTWFARKARDLLGCDVRVEQVGDRDRAKAAGGLGVCGLALCCATWQTEFPSISIKMAKEQDLAPNPSKISGVCGRLLCCLSYEVDAYRELRGDLPRVGRRVSTPAGNARVTSVNALTQLVRMRMESGQVIDIPADELRAQYGTAVRPADLEEQVEVPVRNRDQALRDALIARLTPINVPPPDSARPSGRPLKRGSDRPQRGEGNMPAGSSRREPSRRGGGSDPGAARGDGGRPARTSRRRPGDPRDTSPPPGSRSGPSTSGQPQQPGDARGPSDETPSTDTTADGPERKRRRRGRRGGRGHRRNPGTESTSNGGGNR